RLRRTQRARSVGPARFAAQRGTSVMIQNENPTSSGPEAAGFTATDPQLALQGVYLKDCSYEAPNGPRISVESNPQINLELHTGVNTLAPDMREVVLTVTVAAKQGDATLFLVEVKQAGVFLMRNLSEADAKRAIASICPNVLFPYARAAVSNLVTQGG